MDNSLSLLRDRKWTAFLKSLPAERLVTFKMESAQDIDSLISIAGRINSHSDNINKYSISADFDTLDVKVILKPRS